jgi:hypothetical protein
VYQADAGILRAARFSQPYLFRSANWLYGSRGLTGALISVASIAEIPFGGVKDSGFGREGGVEGLQCYTVVKNVSHLTA